MFINNAGYVSFFIIIVVYFLSYARTAESKSPAPVPVYTFNIINTYPHDQQAFTQGLFFENGVLYEGTGLKGQSTLRKVKLETGDVLKIHRLPHNFFGEGITAVENKIIQLTWQTHVAFVYDKETFKVLNTFYYPTEGWGITYDGRQLIMSDGSANLYFLDRETYKETGRITVHDNDGPVTRLNELEYVRGEIFANIWPTDRIAKIDLQTGRITGWIDLEKLSPLKNNGRTENTLNGIAYDAKKDRLFVTGKLWPYIYEIKLVLKR